MDNSYNESYAHIESALKKYGFEFRDLYNNHVVSRQLITELKSGRTSTLSKKTAEKIASFIGCSLSEIYGTDDKESAQSDEELDARLMNLMREANRNEETRAMLEDLANRPDLRVLLHAGRNASPEEITAVAEMLLKLKRGNYDEF